MIFDDEIQYCLEIGNMLISEACLTKLNKAFEMGLMDFNEYSMTNEKYEPLKNEIKLTIFESNITDDEINQFMCHNHTSLVFDTSPYADQEFNKTTNIYTYIP